MKAYEASKLPQNIVILEWRRIAAVDNGRGVWVWLPLSVGGFFCTFLSRKYCTKNSWIFFNFIFTIYLVHCYIGVYFIVYIFLIYLKIYKKIHFYILYIFPSRPFLPSRHFFPVDVFVDLFCPVDLLFRRCFVPVDLLSL